MCCAVFVIGMVGCNILTALYFNWKTLIRNTYLPIRILLKKYIQNMYLSTLKSFFITYLPYIILYYRLFSAKNIMFHKQKEVSLKIKHLNHNKKKYTFLLRLRILTTKLSSSAQINYLVV